MNKFFECKIRKQLKIITMIAQVNRYCLGWA
jgi:hypothetical protein